MLSRWETVQDLIEHLGGIPAERIRLSPVPGTATEADLIPFIDGPQKWPVELIDGVLVNKAINTRASIMSSWVAHQLGNYGEETELGVVISGTFAFRCGLNTALSPAFSFIPWDNFPGGIVPDESIGTFLPSVVGEVIRTWNTETEIRRKIETYLTAGIEVVWIIDPELRTAQIHDQKNRVVQMDESGFLEATITLPDFRLPLIDVFESVCRKKSRQR